MTKISQWISSYRSSSTLLSTEPDAGEASNCCWCLCNWPWSLVTRSSNKLWINNNIISLVLNYFGKVSLFRCDGFIDLHSLLFYLYLVRRGIQCSAAILPSMPTLANWSQNWSLSSSCSSLISSSSREATPLAVFGYFNKIRSNQLALYLLNFITATILYIIFAFSFHVFASMFCMDEQTHTKLDTE